MFIGLQGEMLLINLYYSKFNIIYIMRSNVIFDVVAL